MSCKKFYIIQKLSICNSFVKKKDKQGYTTNKEETRLIHVTAQYFDTRGFSESSDLLLEHLLCLQDTYDAPLKKKERKKNPDIKCTPLVYVQRYGKIKSCKLENCKRSQTDKTFISYKSTYSQNILLSYSLKFSPLKAELIKVYFNIFK